MSVPWHPGRLRLVAVVLIAAGAALIFAKGYGPMLSLWFLSPYLVCLLLLPIPKLAGAAAGSALGMTLSMLYVIWAMAKARESTRGIAYGLVLMPAISLAFFVLPGVALGLFADWRASRSNRQP
jgi:hypothetical protein